MKAKFILIFIVSAIITGIFFYNIMDGDRRQQNTETCISNPDIKNKQIAAIGSNLDNPNTLVTTGGNYLGKINPDISLKNNNGKIALFFFAFCVLIYGVIITIPQNMRIKEIED